MQGVVMAQKGLSRENIVPTALALLDDVGLDGLNMRALATRLDVKAPALYWHFASKQDLVDEMATSLWREVQERAQFPADEAWPERMLRFAHGLRETLLSHRDGARLFSGTYLTDVSILEAQEKPLAELIASGMSLETAVEISNVLYSFTIGSTIEEQSVVQAYDVDDRYDLANRERRISPDKYPLMTAAGRLTFPDPGARFERMVRRLIASFADWDSRPIGPDS